MPIEGSLQIDLYPLTDQANRVSIQSSRPLQAAQVFEGKTPQEVLMHVPLLFSVCGIAQATAAARALRQAQRLTPAVAVDTAQALLVLMETAREHLWRILIDWPALIDETPDATRAPPLQSLLTAFRDALCSDGDAFSPQAEIRLDVSALHRQIDRLDTLLAELVFDAPPAQWLAMAEVDALHGWIRQGESTAASLLREVAGQGWQGLGSTESGFLPALSASGLNRRLAAPDADRFIAEPLWNDRPYETTPLTRQNACALLRSLCLEYGNGLLPRLVARLVELAGIPRAMRHLLDNRHRVSPSPDNSQLPAGTGIGQVEAARGHLVHRVVLADGYVQRYQILAPTEWNFHPAGVVVRSLSGLVDSDEAVLRRQAALLINAVDPCVGYELRVH